MTKSMRAKANVSAARGGARQQQRFFLRLGQWAGVVVTGVAFTATGMASVQADTGAGTIAGSLAPVTHSNAHQVVLDSPFKKAQTVPTHVHAIGGDTSVTVTWAGPSTVDGAPVTSWTVTASTGQQVTAQQPNHWVIFPGLKNGVSVTFRVTATSSKGTSQASPTSNRVTPNPIAPPKHVILGKAQKVTYDHYSLKIGGKRVFIFSGEFDPWRTPSPSLWVDRLEKMKAAGFNAVTVYFNWDYTSPAPGVYNFSGIRNMNQFLNDAQKVGLYVIARPGPYINAETDGGGFPGWLVTQSGVARTNAPDYLAAADQWLSEIDAIIAAHQITRGGDVILYQVENENQSHSQASIAGMQALEAKAAQDGINVPTLANNYGSAVSNWASGPGATNLYGSDVYPLGFNCANTQAFGTPPNLSGTHNLGGPNKPLISPEYQGGSFNGWGSSANYAMCRTMTGSSFENVYYKQNLATGVTVQSNYMTVGGTNWGWLPAPFMYTSYDYGAAIAESGKLPSKYAAEKLIIEQTQAVAPLTKTESTATPQPSNPGVLAIERANPSTGTRFLYLSQTNPSSTATVQTHASLTLGAVGHYTYGDTNSALQYSGTWTPVKNQSYTSGDYQNSEDFSNQTGASVTVKFTGTAVQWIGPKAANHGIANVYLDGKKVAAVDSYAPSTEFQQVLYGVSGLSNTTHTLKIVVSGQKNPASGGTFVSINAINVPSPGTYFPSIPKVGSITIRGREAKFLVANWQFGAQDLVYSTSEVATQAKVGQQRALLLYGDSGTTGETVLHYHSQPSVDVLSGNGNVTSHWNAATGNLRLDYTHSGLTEVRITAGTHQLLLLIGTHKTAEQFWKVSTSVGTVLVRGSNLVRTARVAGSTLVLTGDTSAAGPIQVWGPAMVRKIVWDGTALATTMKPDGSFNGTLAGPPSITLPKLTGWRFMQGAPERLLNYNDSNWQIANHMSTTNPTKPVTLPVLYADDYGFHHGFVWYRGQFTGQNNVSGITLTADGGSYGAFSVWLNGTFLGSNTTGGEQQQTFKFPKSLLRSNAKNVVSVLVENMGHNEDGGSNDSQKRPRGLLGASLHTSTGAAPQVTWRLQGNKGGTNLQDKVRGVMNPAGLYGTNHGWNLPGFPDQNWKPVSLPNTWASQGIAPGIGWYRTNFTLNIPKGVTAPIALTMSPVSGGKPGSTHRQYQAFIYLNGWLVGRYINYLGPQQRFYLPAGILNDHGKNTLAIAVWGLSNHGGGLGNVGLVTYSVERGGIPVKPVSAPGYSPAVYGPPVIKSAPNLSLQTSSRLVEAGHSATVTATLLDSSRRPLKDAAITLRAPSGWTVKQNSPNSLDVVRPGQKVMETFIVTPPQTSASAGDVRLTGTATWKSGHRQSSTGDTVGMVTPYASLAASYDNTGITSNSVPNPHTGFLGFDGIGTTFSAQGLAADGLQPGVTVNVNGTSLTWPNVPPGQHDNTMALGQIIQVSGEGKELTFITSSNNSTLSGTGVIYYTDGTTSQFTLNVGNFWYPPGQGGNPNSTQVAAVNYANYPTGSSGHTVYLFGVSVPLQAGKTVEAVKLPSLSSVAGYQAAMHIFALGIS
ncbi:beta-galactosidase [Alicyclobacillus sp. ALC3]|nr:beta-galactosidase [Alicyclobacillus sp. ALC3]